MREQIVTHKKYSLAVVCFIALFIASGCLHKNYYFVRHEADIIHSAVMNYKRDMGTDAYFALHQDKNLVSILSSASKDKNGKSVGPWLLDKNPANLPEKGERGEPLVVMIDIKTQDIFSIEIWEGEHKIWTEIPYAR